ncbi:tigger transposable element derived 5-like [Haliotis cracherodii]|uniref:tigger transposable element derived 5-like n=1 Tax=Haliotis cracherodii TaxID=6455 RepID=UPI0039E86EF9
MRKAYTVQEKLDVVKKVRDGVSQASVSRQSGVPAGTIRGWIKNEEKLQSAATECHDSKGPQTKRIRGADDTTLDKALFEWFTQSRHECIPLSGEILKVQAKKMSRKINGDNDTFKASDGWLWRFQRRQGIKSITVSGESKSADVESAAAYPSILRDIIDVEGLHDEHIYNADETGLYYRMLTDKTLAEKNDPRQKTGFKKAKQRVTVLLACNKTGHHKLKPLVIGTVKNPCALHHVNRSTLPVVYQSSKNAWMTAYIFK